MQGRSLAVVVVLVVLGAACALAAAGAAAGGGVVLGARAFAPHGGGFGTVMPRRIFNGGDPSGLVRDIRWMGWGSPSAFGTGRTAIFKPKGGFYPRLVRVELRASRLGRCRSGGPRAYTGLQAREPLKPGGRLGKWFEWADDSSICRAP